jgi:hypothetical protein
MYNITIQLSGIASSNIYRTDDKPLYRRGDKQLIAINVGTIALYVFTKFYYVFRNKPETSKWNSMTKAEQAWYLQNNSETGNKRLDFLFDN